MKLSNFSSVKFLYKYYNVIFSIDIKYISVWKISKESVKPLNFGSWILEFLIPFNIL